MSAEEPRKGSTLTLIGVITALLAVYATTRHDWAASPLEGGHIRITSPTPPLRHKFIGDVHGDAEGLKTLLHHAGLIRDPAAEGPNACAWAAEEPIVVVQVGDVVDRGPGAMEAWECLDTLQRTSRAKGDGSHVLRLLGNHELMWLKGRYMYRNKRTDDGSVLKELTRRIWSAVLRGDVHGAHVVMGGSVLVSHSGFRPAFIDHVLAQRQPENADGVVAGLAEVLAEETNRVLRETLSACEPLILNAPHTKREPCRMAGEFFDAGPDRGGRGIGGPFWTDFSVLKEAPGLPQVLQVVGHTRSRCDANTPNCEPVEYARGSAAINVDGAMVYGNRAYLEYDSSRNKFLTHSLVTSGSGESGDDPVAGGGNGWSMSPAWITRVLNGIEVVIGVIVDDDNGDGRALLANGELGVGEEARGCGNGDGDGGGNGGDGECDRGTA